MANTLSAMLLVLPFLPPPTPLQVAPASIAPHLPALVGEVRGMWDTGRLGEGERVLLWEGMLAASQAAEPHVQASLVQIVLQPLHAEWTSPAWQAATASTQAFAAAFLPVSLSAARVASHAAASTSGQSSVSGGGGGGYELGSRDKRWTLYHQVSGDEWVSVYSAFQANQSFVE